MPDMSGWTPVTAVDGTVLGWMAPADVETPLERAFRRDVAGARAGLIDQAAALLPDPSFDADRAVESGMTWAELDSASYIALILKQAELSAE